MRKDSSATLFSVSDPKGGRLCPERTRLGSWRAPLERGRRRLFLTSLPRVLSGAARSAAGLVLRVRRRRQGR